MTRPLQVIEGEPRSPRVYVALAQPEGPTNQIYLKVQPDGGVLFYMASSLDRPLQEVFDYYAYNGYMTDAHFIKMGSQRRKLLDVPFSFAGLIFKVLKVLSLLTCHPSQAKSSFVHVLELVAEYEAFLRLLHLLSRLKFRKANLPEQDAVNALVAHLLQMAPRRQRRHRLVNCGVQATPEFADKECDVRVECKDASVDSEPRLQDQIIQERVKTFEAGVVAVVETRDAGEQAALFEREDAIKFAESHQQPEVLTALRGEQDSLLYRAFCLYSEFVPEACENLLSEVNCALMFRDGDLMAVPLHPAIRGLPPALAREYFNKIVSRRKSAESTSDEKDAEAKAESPVVSPSAAPQPLSEPHLNYREFKALVFLASQWICQTQNSYWSFVRIVRDTLLPGLFRADPWQQQASVELQGLAFRGKQAASSASSETQEVETTEQTATSYSSSSSEGEGSTSSSSVDHSSTSSMEARSRSAAAGARSARRAPAGRGGDGGRRDKVFGGYDDEQPIGMDTVFYEEEAQHSADPGDSEDSSNSSSTSSSRDQQPQHRRPHPVARSSPPPLAGGGPLSVSHIADQGVPPWMGGPPPPFEAHHRRELQSSPHKGCRLIRR
ncbi:hypothetical protein ACSSS7_005102 [Eimeria intestinalis]